MTISIVTISYNQAAFLEATIESVLSQNSPSCEYIIVDGGSTDGSLDIIERHRARLKKIIRGPDLGPADALNKGFAEATGQLLGFLNSDDTLLPGTLRKICDWMRAHPKVDFVSGHCLVTDAGGRSFRKMYSDSFNVRQLAYDGCILAQPATFFRRELFDRTGGFNVANRIAWDSELFMDFGLLGARHALLDEFLATYRVHENSITGTNAVAQGRRKLRDRTLERYLGRPINRWDRALRWVCLYWRKLANPRDTCQRIFFGPISGRFGPKR